MLMDVIYKIFLIWSIAHSTYQASNNFDQSLHLSPNFVKEKISADEKASGRRLNGLLTKKCDVALSYEDTVCTKCCIDAWIHNYYTLAFWNSAIKGKADSECLLQNGKKDVFHLHKKTQNKELVVNNNCNENIESGVPVSPVNIESSSSHSLYSSVWCYSSPESSLRCHFQNLHYNLLLKEFAFVYSSSSNVYGIKNIRDLQEQLYLSSVKGHNAFQMRITVVPYTSFVTKYKSKIIHGQSLFMARFKPDNLMHVFHDDLLPIYFTIQELCTNRRSCIEDLKLIITDENERGMYWDLFQLLSKKIILMSEHIVSNRHTWYCFESAFIGLNMISVWYQYGFGKPQGPEIKSTISGHLLRQFTGFVKKELEVPELSNDAPVGVLISRKYNRKILNENEVAAVIQDQLALLSSKENSEVKILSLEENDLCVIISELSRARVAVGMHGAALILGMFLPPGSLLIEIWPFGIDPSAATVYRTMSELEGFGVTYVPWVNEDNENTVFHPEYPVFSGGLSHLSYSEREDIIRSLHENLIQDLECCDNSNWLFRVYQDTKVHISEISGNYKSVSFSSVLKEGLRMSEEYLISDETAGNKMQFQLYPSVVQEAKCCLIRDNYHTKMSLEWMDPWNTKDINCQDIFFEVVVQIQGDSKVIRNVLNDRRFLKKFRLEAETIDTWITCYCDGIEGAVQYVKCV